MFYIYYGYVSADHYDPCDTPCYEIKEAKTEQEVIQFKKEFYEDYIHDECSNVIFRVFDGEEFRPPA